MSSEREANGNRFVKPSKMGGWANKGAPDDGAVMNHYPRKTTVKWEPVMGAVSYKERTVSLCNLREVGARRFRKKAATL